MSEIHVLITLLHMYFPWNWEFSSALSKLQNFGGLLKALHHHHHHHLGTPLPSTLLQPHYIKFHVELQKESSCGREEDISV
jgi:hypothetical protein